MAFLTTDPVTPLVADAVAASTPPRLVCRWVRDERAGGRLVARWVLEHDLAPVDPDDTWERLAEFLRSSDQAAP